MLSLMFGIDIAITSTVIVCQVVTEMQLVGLVFTFVVQGMILLRIIAANWFTLPAMTFKMVLGLGEK